MDLDVLLMENYMKCREQGCFNETECSSGMCYEHLTITRVGKLTPIQGIRSVEVSLDVISNHTGAKTIIKLNPL